MTTTATFPVTVGSNTITITTTVTDALDLCKVTGAFEVFTNAPTQCSACDGTNLVPTHREAKGFDFYEIKCTKCGAKLKMGQLKSGGLFIKRDATFEKYTPANAGKAETNTIELED